MRRSAREAEFTEYVAARRAHLLRAAYLLCGNPLIIDAHCLGRVY
jgi:hypothetical protein